MRLRLPRATSRTWRMALVDGQHPRSGEDSPRPLGREPGAQGCTPHLERRLEAPRREARPAAVGCRVGSPAPLTRPLALPRGGR